MRFKEVSYGRTKNLGQFNSQRCEATIELEPGDAEEVAMSALKEFVHAQLGIEEKKPAKVAKPVTFPQEPPSDGPLRRRRSTT